MTGNTTQMTMECEISLWRRRGDSVTCTASLLKEEDGTVSLEAALAPDAWGSAVEEGALGLVDDAFVNGGPDMLDPKLPVFVRLRLRDGLPPGLQLQHVADHLARGTGAGADAGSWVVCEALQDVVLPGDIDGTARMGFRTAWAALADEGPPGLEALTAEWLATAGAEAESVEPGLLRVPMEAEGHQWIMVVRTDDDTNVVGFYSVFPEPVPEDARHGVALFLMSQNYDLPFGGFEMDPEDGEVRLRTAWAGGPGESPTGAQLYELVSPHAPLMAAHIGALAELVGELLGTSEA